MMTTLRDLSPLAVFLLLGAAVFALDRWVVTDTTEGHVIRVTEEQIAGVQERWVAQWGRPPTPQELEGLLDDTVREEILYREAQRLGLDRDDAIVRRRLAQKMTFLLEDNTPADSPSLQDVEAYYADHADRYREPRRTTFGHIFVSDERRSDPEGEAATLLVVARQSETDDWRRLGDPFMLRREYADRTDQEIGELFGASFAAALSQLSAGEWHGPIASAYGTHLVRVNRRTEPRMPSLDAVRPQVTQDLIDERRREQNFEAFQVVRERYEIHMPVSSATQPPPP